MEFSTKWMLLLFVVDLLFLSATSDHQSSHILNNETFWSHFQSRVLAKSWNCNFPVSLLQDSLEEDSKLYSDDSVFQKRRLGATAWVLNHTLWAEVVLAASKEIVASEGKGPQTRQLEELHMLEAFQDYIDHLNFFYRVASKMAENGQPVTVLSQDSSLIHDIDKLDPIMIVAYSERFEDGISTSAWKTCVDRHTCMNPHHQAHCLWHDCCEAQNSCKSCNDARTKALREMVCDKVARRVQLNLSGRMDNAEMWDVEVSYFNGLNKEWLEKATQMMHGLKMGHTV